MEEGSTHACVAADAHTGTGEAGVLTETALLTNTTNPRFIAHIFIWNSIDTFFKNSPKAGVLLPVTDIKRSFITHYSYKYSDCLRVGASSLKRLRQIGGKVDQWARHDGPMLEAEHENSSSLIIKRPRPFLLHKSITDKLDARTVKARSTLSARDATEGHDYGKLKMCRLRELRIKIIIGFFRSNSLSDVKNKPLKGRL